MMETVAAASVQRTGGATVLHVRGEIDVGTVDTIRDSVDEAVGDVGPAGFVIDLSDVSYLDSCGVRLMFEVRRRLGPTAPIVAVLSPESFIRKVLELVDVPSVIPLYPSLPDALSALREA